jgi:hypothetical protein
MTQLLNFLTVEFIALKAFFNDLAALMRYHTNGINAFVRLL